MVTVIIIVVLVLIIFSVFYKKKKSPKTHQKKGKLAFDNLQKFKADKYYLSEIKQHSIAIDYARDKICILDRSHDAFTFDFDQLLKVELPTNYETAKKRFTKEIELKITLKRYSREQASFNKIKEITKIGFIEQEKTNKTSNEDASGTAKKWFKLISGIIDEEEKKKIKKAQPSMTSDKKYSQSSDLEKTRDKITEQEKWGNFVEKGIIKDETLSKLKVTIDKIERSTLDNDMLAFIIHIKFDNLTSKSKKIEVLKAQYVSKNREQIEQDSWLTGQLIEKETLKPNSFRKAGLIFYRDKLLNICENDLLYLTIRLPKEGKEFALCFQNKNNEWNLQNVETKEIEIKLTPKQKEKNLLKRVERFEAFEERIGVSFEKISMKVQDDGWFYLFFEIHSNEGMNLKEWVKIECVLYDKNGSILQTDSSSINPENFFGFELIKMSFQENNLANKVGKIRLYPKKY